MTESVLLIERDEGLAVVTMNRPAARNALNAALRGALRKAMADLAADDSVGVVVLTGADPAFCAGLDLKELGGGEADVAALTGAAADPDQPMRPWAPLGKPVIGAVNGVAVTGGFELALNCDFLVASERARFADTHSRVGVMPGWGLTVLLPEAVGLRRARELSSTGNFLDARTALQWGLVNHVVAHDELLPAATALARDVLGNDAAGVRQILATYDAVACAEPSQRAATETRMARAWSERGPRADEIARRRESIQARGRSQSSNPNAQGTPS